MGRAGIFLAAAALLLAPVVLVGAVAGTLGVGLSGFGGGVGWSQQALGDIPPEMLLLYEQAAAERQATGCPGLDAAVLAAVGKLESDHARSTAPGVHSGLNQAGCCAGPMQFNLTDGPPSTWARYSRPGDDIYDPADAIGAAARKLCADALAGPPSGPDPCPTAPGIPALHRALLAYNAACWYVTRVAEQAAAYRALLAVPADAHALLTNPRVELTPAARADLEAGRIDSRLVTVLAGLADRFPIRVSVLVTGHSYYVAGTRTVSEHLYGRAADIDRIGGEAVSPANPAARAATAWLDSLDGPLRPAEVGSPFPAFDPRPGHFSNRAHLDHLHIGYGPESGIFQQVTPASGGGR